MIKRIFRSICLVAVAVFFASIALIMGVLYNYFSDVQQSQLKMQTIFAARGVSYGGLEYFKRLETGQVRITWIDESGEVLYDSKSNTAQMENHLERKEIQEAFASGYGESRRYSATLMEQLFYCAMRLDDGTVLRLSVTRHTILTLILGMVQPICIVFFIAVLLSVLLAVRLSKKIVRPINEINLDDPLSNKEYDELSPFLRRIDKQQTQLKQQKEQLKRKERELDTIVGSMKEGMILLNRSGKIISMNPSAQKLLNTDRFCIGQDILTVNRNLGLQEVFIRALEGRAARQTVLLQGGSYQVDASPIISEPESAAGSAAGARAQGSLTSKADPVGNAVPDEIPAGSCAPEAVLTEKSAPEQAVAVWGVAVLLLDVTEKEKAEQMRREFTANVSHELKTPLHTISGYAELLQNGMVESKDTIPFAGKIYTEAQRMVRLVEDIISLSHLDEGAGDMDYKETDLYALAETVVRSLEPEAKAAGVTLALSGERAVIRGIPQLLQSIVYNICDNAIKYNRKDGSVALRISRSAADVTLCVKDTGIGIDAQHRERIFERFYRVDKSHSKEVGGTGLGLSIVKHAARIHNAKIEVQSILGEGTDITVTFPI